MKQFHEKGSVWGSSKAYIYLSKTEPVLCSPGMDYQGPQGGLLIIVTSRSARCLVARVARGEVDVHAITALSGQGFREGARKSKGSEETGA